MELAVREAKARLLELVAAAEKGERVVITRHGMPARMRRSAVKDGVVQDQLLYAIVREAGARSR